MTLRIDNYTPNQMPVLEEPNYIFLAIREGLAPFRAVRVDIEIQYDVDFCRYVVWASVWFGKRRLANYVYVDVHDFASDPTLAQLRVAEEMFLGYRFRSIEDVPDNIELGAN